MVHGDTHIDRQFHTTLLHRRENGPIGLNKDKAFRSIRWVSREGGCSIREITEISGRQAVLAIELNIDIAGGREPSWIQCSAQILNITCRCRVVDLPLEL